MHRALMTAAVALAASGVLYAGAADIKQKPCPCANRAMVTEIRIESPALKRKSAKPLLQGAKVGPYHCKGRLAGLRVLGRGKSTLDEYSIDRGSIICSVDGTVVDTIDRLTFDDLKFMIEEAYSKNARVTLGVWREKKSLTETIRTWSPFD